MPRLSPRLKALADMVPMCDTFTDIGTDHGYLPIWLSRNGICRKAYAADINKGPLDSARANAKEYGAEDCIEFILSDGLKEISVPVGDGLHVLCIAGMGGENIIEILSNNLDKAKAYGTYLFSPHTKQEELRRYLGGHGFHIEAERYVVDDGKPYVIIRAVQGDDSCNGDTDYMFGRFVTEALKDAAVRDCFLRKYDEISALLEGGRLPDDRRCEFEKEWEKYREVLGL